MITLRAYRQQFHWDRTIPLSEWKTITYNDWKKSALSHVKSLLDYNEDVCHSDYRIRQLKNAVQILIQVVGECP